jgi:hypothetical protein
VPQVTVRSGMPLTSVKTPTPPPTACISDGCSVCISNTALRFTGVSMCAYLSCFALVGNRPAGTGGESASAVVCFHNLSLIVCRAMLRRVVPGEAKVNLSRRTKRQSVTNKSTRRSSAVTRATFWSPIPSSLVLPVVVCRATIKPLRMDSPWNRSDRAMAINF